MPLIHALNKKGQFDVEIPLVSVAMIQTTCAGTRQLNEEVFLLKFNTLLFLELFEVPRWPLF